MKRETGGQQSVGLEDGGRGRKPKEEGGFQKSKKQTLPKGMQPYKDLNFRTFHL